MKNGFNLVAGSSWVSASTGWSVYIWGLVGFVWRRLKMLVHNKYLQELGVGENTYPLGNSCNHENELDEDMGVVVCQTWNLNLTLAMEIYTYLRAFKDIKPGYPACFSSPEEWDSLLDEMADGFADYIKQKDEPQPDMTKLERSLDLLKEYWEALWW